MPFFVRLQCDHTDDDRACRGVCPKGSSRRLCLQRTANDVASHMSFNDTWNGNEPAAVMLAFKMQQWSWSRVNFSCGDCSPGGTSRFHWRSLLCWRQITSTSPSAQHFCYDFDILTARNTNGNGFHNLGVANPVGPASESLFCSFTAWWNPQNDFTPRDCGLKSLPKNRMINGIRAISSDGYWNSESDDQ